MADTQPTTPCLEMAHVLFMDVVAYSTLPMDQQQQLLAELQQLVRTSTEFVRAQAEDQLIRLPTGDGMALVFFHDPEAPVRCALELSRGLRNRPEIKLRMGIHTGPVYRVADINANRNVAGGGINIAQRVMDCGDGGHILLSSSAAEVLAQLSSWRHMLHDLGDVEVKHAVRIHLFNLYTDEAGNPELPKKIRSQMASAKAATSLKKKKSGTTIAVTMVAVGLVAVGYWLLFAHKVHALRPTDTIVLADFTNTTGDAVFDGSLRQGLSVQLEQSPFLSIISDQQIQQTLQMMGRKPDAKLTPEISRELCQRTGSAAFLDGSITQIGAPYLITVKAMNCVSGESLASTEAQASDKSHVLDALGKAASEIRNKLGESLSTVQKFDTPLQQATTPSLEALQAYSLAGKASERESGDTAVPLFQRAIKLDPNFAMAYLGLGLVYVNRGESSLAFENIRRAFELRDGVSEKEKSFIESAYYFVATGDLEKAQQDAEVWAQTYPRDSGPRDRLGIIYETFGQYDKSLAEMREALRLSPESVIAYGNVVDAYLWLNRLEEARATAEEAKAKNLDTPHLHDSLYQLAFLQNDAAGMAQQAAWLADKSGWEDRMLANEANTAAYSGQLGKAREFSRRAIVAAERAEKKATAAHYEAAAALREAVFGNEAEARRRAASALGLSTGQEVDVRYGAALAMGLTGDISGAQALADDLAKRFPEDTIVQFNFLPTLHAQLALSRNDAAKAIEVLQAAAPYELGDVGTADFYPIFVRGKAYLAAHQGGEAAVEFQKILDHRGIVLNSPIGALAHLQLGRAYAMQGDTAKARAAYQDFLTLWKDADPDIPILKQAKAEYAKLK